MEDDRNADLLGGRFQELGSTAFGARKTVWQVVRLMPGDPPHALIRDTAARLPDKTVGVAVLTDRHHYRRLPELLARDA